MRTTPKPQCWTDICGGYSLAGAFASSSLAGAFASSSLAGAFASFPVAGAFASSAAFAIVALVGASSAGIERWIRRRTRHLNRTETQAQQVSRAKINELLRERHQRFTPLQRLLRQAANQDSWTAQLQALLPDSLARDCQVTEVAGPVVVIACRSAASATKLRFMAPELTPRLAELSSFRGIQEIRIRVSAEER